MNGTTQDTIQDDNRDAVILDYYKVPRTREKIQNYVGIKNRPYFSKNILKQLLDSNKLSMTIHDKPNSKLQKYVKEEK